MTTERLDWIDAVEFQEIPDDDHNLHNVLLDIRGYSKRYIHKYARAFARTVVAAYIERQEVVAWQYQWLYPGTTNTEWHALSLDGETIKKNVAQYSKLNLRGSPKYKVRALCVKETK